jgi:uncharacterized membrane protein
MKRDNFRMLMLLLGLMIVSQFSLSSEVRAGLNFCNDTGQRIYLAVGWSEDNDWKARGWFAVDSRGCVQAIQGDLKDRYYWYFANTDGNKIIWSGSKDPNNGAFCVTTAAFFFKGASRTDCDYRSFTRLDTGDSVIFTNTLTEAANDPLEAARSCSAKANPMERDAFAKCWVRAVSTTKQRAILDCWDKKESYASFALCANSDTMDSKSYKLATCTSKYLNEGKGSDFLVCAGNTALTSEQAKIFDCAVAKRSDVSSIVTSCALQGQMTDEQRKVVNCVTSNSSSYTKMATCASGVFMTPEQNRIVNCVASNRSQYTQMAVCALGNKLTPEQQVFASCAISTGGQPYAFAGCVGTQLTMNELQKCIDQGIGGNGCFGQNNTAVKVVSNAWHDVTKGPGPSNDLLGREGFAGRTLENARHDLEEGPGPTNDLFGGGGFTGRTLEDIRKSAPPPLTIGGGSTRVCIPWC